MTTTKANDTKISFNRAREIADHVYASCPQDVYPLYMHYDGQSRPQDAYICLACDGTVWADYNPQVGPGYPLDVHHGRTLRWYLPYAEVTGEEINDLVEDVWALLERVHEGHVVEWRYGVTTEEVGSLNPDAIQAYAKIEERIESTFGYHWEPEFAIHDVDEWYDDDKTGILGCGERVTAQTTDEELQRLADDERRFAYDEGVILDGDLVGVLREIRDAL